MKKIILFFLLLAVFVLPVQAQIYITPDGKCYADRQEDIVRVTDVDGDSTVVTCTLGKEVVTRTVPTPQVGAMHTFSHLITSFSVSTNPVYAGDQTTVSWAVDGAVSELKAFGGQDCDLGWTTPRDKAIPSGSQTLTGSIPGTCTIRLVASTGTTSESATIDVVVEERELFVLGILDFFASSTAIDEGESIDLTYSVENADEVTGSGGPTNWDEYRAPADPTGVVTRTVGVGPFTAPGEVTLTLTATRQGSQGDETVTDTIVITVRDLQDPVFVQFPSDQQMTRGSVRDLVIAGSDPDGGQTNIDCSFAPNASFVSVVSDTDGRLELRAAPTTQTQLGEYAATCTITDDEGDTASRSFVLTVAESAQKVLTVDAGPDREITLPDNTVTLAGSVTSENIDDDPSITWTKVSGPSGTSFSSTSALRPEVTFTQSGTYVFGIEATADGLSDDDEVTVVVNPAVNRPPVCTLIGGWDEVAAAGEVWDVFFSLTDPDDDEVRLVLTAGPSGMAVEPSGFVSSGSTVALRWLSPAPGTYTVSWKCEDTSGATSKLATRTLRVGDGRTTILAAIHDHYTVMAGETIERNVTGNDHIPDSTAFSTDVLSGTVYGTLLLKRDGSFTYHAAGEPTTDTFQYSLVSARGDSSDAHVHIDVVPRECRYDRVLVRVLSSTSVFVGSGEPIPTPHWEVRRRSDGRWLADTLATVIGLGEIDRSRSGTYPVTVNVEEHSCGPYPDHASIIFNYIVPSTTASEGDEHLPTDVVLAENYPNPFNPETTIPYRLPEASEVEIVVFNTLGREVATLARGFKSAGRHEAVFRADGLPSGVYLYRMRAGNVVRTGRMVLQK